MSLVSSYKSKRARAKVKQSKGMLRKKEGGEDGRDLCTVLPTDFTITSYFATL